MTLDLIYDGYEEYLEDKHIELEESVGLNINRESAIYIFKFPSKYGVIIEKHKYSKGYTLDRWEMTPVKFSDTDDNYQYMTREDDEAIKELSRTRGSLTNEQVCKYLERYKNL